MVVTVCRTPSNVKLNLHIYELPNKHRLLYNTDLLQFISCTEKVNIKEDRQCTVCLNITMRRVRVTTVTGGKQYYILCVRACVCVCSLIYPECNAHKIFGGGKKLLNMKCVFFSTTFL